MSDFTESDLRKKGYVKQADGSFRKSTGKTEHTPQTGTNMTMYSQMTEHGMTIIPDFILEIPPKSCPRPRVTKTGHAYMPSDYKLYKKALIVLLKNANIPSVQYNKIECVFYFEFPKSVAIRNRIDNVPKTTKPDGDNLLKTVCDALEQAGIVKNDSQFSHGSFEKLYTVGTPRIKIKLS